MSVPSISSGMGVAGCAATASSQDAKSGVSPPTMYRAVSPDRGFASSAATSRRAWDTTRTFTPESRTMYSVSGAVSRELIAV